MSAAENSEARETAAQTAAAEPLPIDPLSVYTIEEAAQRLRVSVRTLYALKKRGKLKSRSIAGRRVYPGKFLLEFLDIA